MHNAGAARIGEKLATVADEPTRGHAEFETHATIAIRRHAYHFAPTGSEFLGNHAEVVFGTVDDHHLDRLVQLTSDFFGDDLRAGHLQFVAFTAHHFDQDGQLQLSPSADAQRLGVVRLFNPDAHVVLGLFEQPLTHLPRGDKAALAAGEGGSIDAKE